MSTEVPAWLLSVLVVSTVWFTGLGLVRLLATPQLEAAEARDQRRLAGLALVLAGISATTLVVLLVVAARA